MTNIPTSIRKYKLKKYSNTKTWSNLRTEKQHMSTAQSKQVPTRSICLYTHQALLFDGRVK